MRISQKKNPFFTVRAFTIRLGHSLQFFVVHNNNSLQKVEHPLRHSYVYYTFWAFTKLSSFVHLTLVFRYTYRLFSAQLWCSHIRFQSLTKSQQKLQCFFLQFFYSLLFGASLAQRGSLGSFLHSVSFLTEPASGSSFTAVIIYKGILRVRFGVRRFLFLFFSTDV